MGNTLRFVPLSEIQEYYYSKDFKLWTLGMIYEVEQELKAIAERFWCHAAAGLKNVTRRTVISRMPPILCWDW